MPVPDKLLIPFEDFDGGQFTHIGRFGSGNQFLGYITYASPKFYHTEEVTSGGQIVWRERTNCFAVLHHFDGEGNHLSAEVVRVEGTQDSEYREWAKLEEMISALGEIAYGDIWVKLFQLEIEGVAHGLIYESEFWEEDGEEHEWIMLEPNDIMFHPPWDSGEYST